MHIITRKKLQKFPVQAMLRSGLGADISRKKKSANLRFQLNFRGVERLRIKITNNIFLHECQLQLITQQNYLSLTWKAFLLVSLPQSISFL